MGSMRRWLTCLACLALLSMAACGSVRSKGSALDQAQYDYSAAIRWGDFEGAWQMVDSSYRDAHPLTDLELERYKQVQVSGYNDLAARASEDGTAMREIRIGIINRNTMAERTVRYTEAWRYDDAAKRWVVTGGLPDFWQGE